MFFFCKKTISGLIDPSIQIHFSGKKKTKYRFSLIELLCYNCYCIFSVTLLMVMRSGEF